MIFSRNKNIFSKNFMFANASLFFCNFRCWNCFFATSRFLSCKSLDTPEVRGGFASNEGGAATTAFGGTHSSTADDLWQKLFIGWDKDDFNDFSFFGRLEICFVMHLTKGFVFLSEIVSHQKVRTSFTDLLMVDSIFSRNFVSNVCK